eukprot:s1190_g26.t1
MKPRFGGPGRDLQRAEFDGCRLAQGEADSSKSEDLQGYLITYADDFLVLSSSATAHASHTGIGPQLDGRLMVSAKPSLGTLCDSWECNWNATQMGVSALTKKLMLMSSFDEVIRSQSLSPTCQKEDEAESDSPQGDEVLKETQRIAGMHLAVTTNQS